jgi:hypothetical protein
LGIGQPRVSDLVRSKRDKFSLDMLATLATCAGRHVELALSRLFSTAIPVTGLRVNEYANLRKTSEVFCPCFLRDFVTENRDLLPVVTVVSKGN